MRIRVPRRGTFAVVLTLLILAACSYYVFNARRRLSPSTRAAAFRFDSADAQQSTDADALLAVADHFYGLNNGPAAAPLYVRAEKLFSERGDARNELRAKVGRLRSEAERVSFVDPSRRRAV